MIDQFFKNCYGYSITTILRKLGFLSNKTVLIAVFVLAVVYFNRATGGHAAQPNTDMRVLGGAVVATVTEPAVLSLEHPLTDDNDFVAFPADDGNVLDTVARTFALPARGRNWGDLHSYNAVDIAGVCDASIHAAARGRVSEVKEGWNGGYGNYVVIDHGNGVATKYAHTSRNLAQVGQEVAAGDSLARMGDTGHSTGCHVHFEVYGAPNPFVFR